MEEDMENIEYLEDIERTIEKEIDSLLGEDTREVTEEDSIYSEDARDELLEDDELTSEEVGFMNGYDEAYV